MIIGGKEYTEILVQDTSGAFIASITDEDIISESGHEIILLSDRKIVKTSKGEQK